MSEVSIYNLALNAIGTRSNVAIPTERSREAEVCRLWYDLVRDSVLAAGIWPEATGFVSLAQSAEETDDTWTSGDPRPGYQYSYTLPSDMLRPQFLSDYSPFLIGEGLLFSNYSPALFTYTKRLTDTAAWSPELRMAIVYALAAHICMPLTGKPSRAKVLLEQANMMILQARVSAANASQDRLESIPDWITARGGVTHQTTRFFYPTGQLLSLPNVS